MGVSALTREPLENARQGETIEFDHMGHKFYGRAGLYPNGRLGEVWLHTGKTGTQLNITMQDSAIAASLALQFGCPIEVLRHAFLRDDEGYPAGPLGHLFDRLEELRLEGIIRGWERPEPLAPAETFWNRFRRWVGAA